MKNLVGSDAVFLQGQAVNEYIIKVNCDLACSDQISKDHIHKCLESSGGIGKSEEHYLRLKQASISGEHRFPFVSCFDADVVVSPADIELGEKAGVLKAVDDIGG
jgi:hypothetical protein